MKVSPFLAGFAIAAGLFSLFPITPRPASAAPDNTLGMAILSARISATGAIVRGSGNTSITKDLTGIYHVGFNRDVSTCFYAASLIFHTGETRTQPSSLGATKVAVITQDSSGAFKDADFYLLVHCPR